MADSQEVVTHLLSCCDGVYLGLGESAPKISTDATVVRVHEMSRSFGSLALALRQSLGASDVEPLAIIRETLDQALRDDVTGSMTLYAMALVIGPRLLVSLRDAREALASDAEVTALLEHAAQVVVAEIRSIATLSQDEHIIDDPEWEEAARALRYAVENAGNADSFGLSR
jgi:hypothetical protein